MVELDSKPKRPHDMGSKWAENPLWVHGGAAIGSTGHCWCRQGRFALDYYGRVFMPEAWGYCVSVMDTNGNVMVRVGRHGNVDSAGPKSAVPLGGDEIGLYDPHYAATHTDKRLFISDVGNRRVVCAKRGYHAEAKVPLKDVRDGMKDGGR